MFSVKPYQVDLLSDWNRVLQDSINGTFMHSRNFMEYHDNRFKDVSVVIYKKALPVGIFTANKVAEAVYSHQGLTYGGLILTDRLAMAEIFSVLKEVLRHFNKLGIKMIYIKEIPSFYGTSSLEWMPYCMFLLGAESFRTDLSFAIPLPTSSRFYSKGRQWRINKARKYGLNINETKDFSTFWEKVLVPNLWQRHQVKPVHTLDEIHCLSAFNAPFIRQFEVWEKGEIVAGTTVFETQTTAHTQYISSTPRGRDLGALGLLIDHLVQRVFSHKAFFDFGTVNENEGKNVNRGLMEWKESFGAKPYVHQFYKLDPGRFEVLDKAMVFT